MENNNKFETTYGKYKWKSRKGPILVSEMSDTYIKRCLERLKPKSEWYEIFHTELEERAKERNRIKTEVNPKNPKVFVTIGLSRLPEHCGQCPFYENSSYYDDEAGWGSGYVHYCPFGCSIWGCLNERPDDCPLQNKP